MSHALALPKMIQAGALLLAAVCSDIATSVHACSLAPDYKAPTNFELVQDADVILVGTVVKSIEEKEQPIDHNILVTPSLLLKGSELPKAVFIHGSLSGEIFDDGEKKFRIQSRDSQPFDLWRSHPEGGGGSCGNCILKLAS